MRRLTLAAVLAAALLPAAPAAADQGRALLPSGLPSPVNFIDAAGAQAGVALPDGGAVLFSWLGPNHGLAAVKMLPDGRQDRAFGTRGVARVSLGKRPLFASRALRRPDGRLVVVAQSLALQPSERQETIVVQFTPQGARDTSFGTAGVVHTGLLGGSRAGLAPDGSLVLAGEDAQDRWVVERLTPQGAVDPVFGVRPVAGAPAHQQPLGASVAADGRITTVAITRDSSLAARLLPDGSPDPTFYGGAPAPIDVEATDFATGPDGAVTVLGYTRVVKLDPHGARDIAYGSIELKNATFGRLLAEPDGGVIVYRTPAPQPRAAREAALLLDRIGPTGQHSAPVQPSVRFGGGASQLGATHTSGLTQNGYAIGELLPRPGGGYFAAGGVSLIQYMGEGAGTSASRDAVIALTPDLRLDRTFGPRFATPHAAVRVASHQIPRDRRLRRVLRLRVRASGPGLLAVKVRDRHGRLLAAGLAPVYSRDGLVRIATTPAGRRALRHGIRVRVTGTFRDLSARTLEAVGSRGTAGG